MTEATRKARELKRRRAAEKKRDQRAKQPKAASMAKSASAGSLMIEGMQADLKRWAEERKPHPFANIEAL